MTSEAHETGTIETTEVIPAMGQVETMERIEQAPPRRRDEGVVDLELRVLAMRWEAEGVVSLLLAAPDGAPLPAWEPGAHVELHLPGGLVRQYSLCGDADEPGVWRVAVLREQAGRGGSAHVHDVLRVGEVVRARGPRHAFTFAPAERTVFVAGGIGITPLLPMIARAEREGRDWRLMYGGRTRASMAFLPELAALDGGAGRVRLFPQDEVGHLPLADEFATPQADTRVFACGPPPMLAALEDATADWPAGGLVVERFTAALPDPDRVEAPGTDEAFEVVAATSGVSVEVPPGTTIVEALRDAGLDPVTSCEEGICGTCETAVLEGVPEHRDSLLSEDERAANDTMMICVGRCLGKRLVLDL